MASLAAIGERCTPGNHAAAAIPERYSRAGGLQEAARRTSISPTKNAPPEALALLKARPGIDGAPLGSPAVIAAATSESTETDPIIANAFFGLKPLPASPQGPTSSTGGNRRNKTSRRMAARTKELGSTPAAAAGTKAAGGGRAALVRTGKELVHAGEVGCVGTGGIGDGAGGQGKLSARISKAA